MIRLWRLVVLALVAAAALGGTTAGTAGASPSHDRGDCAVATASAATHAGPSHSPELRAHIDAPRRTAARVGARTDLATCRATTTDRLTAAATVGPDAGAAPRVVSHRAVGDRAPPS